MGTLFAETRPAVVLPERFKNTPILVVNSPEYKKLLEENKELAKQIERDNNNWLLYSKEVDRQAKENYLNQLKLIDDYNKAQLTIEKKETALAKQRFKLYFWRIAFWLLLGLIIVYFAGKKYIQATFPFIAPFLP